MIYSIRVSRIMKPKMKDPVAQMHWAQQVILLIEEILHQLRCIKPCK